MKKFLVMLLILFVCGMVSADLSITALKDQNIVMTLERFTTYAYNDMLFKDVFWGVLYERGKLLAILLLILFTPLREKLPMVLVCVFSFMWGYFLMSCIVSLGMVGIVVGITSVIPHGILYFIVFMLLSQRRQGKRYIQREQVGKSIVTYGLILVLFVTGCILETVMGTQFVPWVIRLSLI